MTNKPIRRYYNFGVTFRWVKGASHIAVKQGYVREGQSFIIRPDGNPLGIEDVPGQPDNDSATWIASIPAPPNAWEDHRNFHKIIIKWVKNNPNLVDLNQRTDKDHVRS